MSHRIFHHMQSEESNALIKLGPYAWLAGAILFMETALVIKFAHNEFTAPFPRHIVQVWAIFGAVLVVSLVAWQCLIWGRSYVNKASPQGKIKKLS